VEGTLTACLEQRNGIHPAAFIGTIAAWSRRFCPIVFAGDEHCAAAFAWRFLVGQITEAERVICKTSKARAGATDDQKRGTTPL